MKRLSFGQEHVIVKVMKQLRYISILYYRVEIGVQERVGGAVMRCNADTDLHLYISYEICHTNCCPPDTVDASSSGVHCS